MGLLQKYRTVLLLLLIILGSLLLLCYRINDPFVGGYQSYSTIYNVIAKNYLRYGYLATKFGWVINSDLVSPEKFIYYTRHPPLFGLILSLGISVLGDHEWSTRLVPILFSIGNIILIFFIAKELWDRELGLIAAFFTGFSPINIFYGSHIDHVGSVVLFFMLATFFSYILWVKRQNNYYLLSMCLFFILGALTAWPAYFLVPFLLIHNLLTKRLKIIWILPLIAVLTFIFFIFYVYILTGAWFAGQIKEMFLFRMGLSKIHPQWTEIGYSLPAEPGINFTFTEFIVKMIYKILVLFSPILVFFSFIWLVNIIKKREIKKELLLIIFFFSFGSYCFVFPNITFQHEYVLICLLGPIAVTSAIGFDTIKNYLPRIFIILIGILLIIQTCIVTYQKHRRLTAGNLWEYMLGKTIHEYVFSEEEVITSSKLSFAAKYYADRFIHFNVNSLKDFIALKNDPQRNYKYFIAQKGDPIKPELLGYLKNNYPCYTKKNFLFFKLH